MTDFGIFSPESPRKPTTRPMTTEKRILVTTEAKQNLKKDVFQTLKSKTYGITQPITMNPSLGKQCKDYVFQLCNTRSVKYGPKEIVS